MFLKVNVTTYIQLRVEIFPALQLSAPGLASCVLPGDVPATGCQLINTPGSESTLLLVSIPNDYLFTSIRSVIEVVSLNPGANTPLAQFSEFP